jgi:hypothetical protein
MQTANKKEFSWFWILFHSNDDQRFEIGASREKHPEYQFVRFIGKDNPEFSGLPAIGDIGRAGRYQS